MRKYSIWLQSWKKLYVYTWSNPWPTLQILTDKLRRLILNWYYLYFEHQLVTNFCLRNVITIWIADSHCTSWCWSCICNRSGSSQSRHVEPNVQILLAGIIDTAYSVRLGFVSHQFRVFLNDQNKFGLSLQFW